jgi:hypothetical protein
VIVLAPAALGFAKDLVYSAYYRSKQFVLVFEGEDPVDSNFYHSIGVLSKNKRFFGGRSLELSSPIAIEGGFLSRYAIEVPRDGDYDIFVAGTPPGPVGRGSKWYSPYSISIDDETPALLTEAGLKREWPHLHEFSYAPGGYYFTRVATRRLAQGRHTVTFRINDRRSHDSRFTFYLDALLVAPRDFEPKSHVGRIPRALFGD